MVDPAQLVATYQDADGDGFSGTTPTARSCFPPVGLTLPGSDCDDNDPARHPDALEVCDALDNDCNGSIDDAPLDGVAVRFDADGDGWGAGAISMVCATATNQVAAAGDEDCDDNDPDLGAPVAWFIDTDADGYGAGAARVACFAESNEVAESGDCNDADPGLSPAAIDVCDGFDNNCDGGVDEDAPQVNGYPDLDGDGYGAGALIQGCIGSQLASQSGDCDDNNPEAHPFAVERCNQQTPVDENCNGLADDDDAGVVGQLNWYADEDGDGFGDPNSGVLQCRPDPGQIANGTDCDDSDASLFHGSVRVPQQAASIAEALSVAAGCPTTEVVVDGSAVLEQSERTIPSSGFAPLVVRSADRDVPATVWSDAGQNLVLRDLILENEAAGAFLVLVPNNGPVQLEGVQIGTDTLRTLVRPVVEVFNEDPDSTMQFVMIDSRIQNIDAPSILDLRGTDIDLQLRGVALEGLTTSGPAFWLQRAEDTGVDRLPVVFSRVQWFDSAHGGGGISSDAGFSIVVENSMVANLDLQAPLIRSAYVQAVGYQPSAATAVRLLNSKIFDLPGPTASPKLLALSDQDSFQIIGTRIERVGGAGGPSIAADGVAAGFANVFRRSSLVDVVGGLWVRTTTLVADARFERVSGQALFDGSGVIHGPVKPMLIGLPDGVDDPESSTPPIDRRGSTSGG